MEKSILAFYLRNMDVLITSPSLRFAGQGPYLGAGWKACDHGNVEASSVSRLEKTLADRVNLHT